MPNNKCRICGSPTKKTGLLYRCQGKECPGVYWDKSGVKKRFRNEPDALNRILEEAKVPEDIKSKKSHFVYILRLKGESNAVYVGMTGHHPYRRYLNHIRGYKSSKYTKNRATALVGFEGPMIYNKAVERELELGLEYEQKNFIVYGPKKIES